MDNEQNHQDLAPTVVLSSILILCLAVISVALRLWSRRIAKAGYWYDDYTIMVALPLALVLPLLLLIGKINITRPLTPKKRVRDNRTCTRY